MRVPGALRICPHNLHCPQAWSLALAEIPHLSARAIFMTKLFLAVQDRPKS